MRLGLGYLVDRVLERQLAYGDARIGMSSHVATPVKSPQVILPCGQNWTFRIHNIRTISHYFMSVKILKLVTLIFDKLHLYVSMIGFLRVRIIYLFFC